MIQQLFYSYVIQLFKIAIPLLDDFCILFEDESIAGAAARIVDQQSVPLAVGGDAINFQLVCICS